MTDEMPDNLPETPSGAEVLRESERVNAQTKKQISKLEAPKHPRWIRKLRSSALAGGVATAATAGLELIGPGALATLGISNPLLLAGAVAGVSLLKDGVGYLTKSDPRDFPKAEAIPAEEMRRLLEKKGSKDADSSIQSAPKKRTPSPKNLSTDMATENVDALKAGITAGVEFVEVGFRVGSDGFQVKDLGVVLTDEELQSKATAFFEKADEAPAEVADLKGSEVLELAMHAFSEAQRLFT